ncbi:hypothetical protein GEV33_007565 [Tenebrio molitor]|uniref:Reverse transcriptase domain-containing protein n=1 Tax=Tenebrio molitor TaxID=7067 RepID=A0A8J6LIQ2_TENMO|nr:hypothetical protein GEV33_007565 [Tenebrio molitor]
MEPLNSNNFSNFFVSSILYTNIASLLAKYSDLVAYVNDLKPTFLSLTETWLSDVVPDSLVSLDGYTIYRNDRNHKKGGGVCIYVSNELLSDNEVIPIVTNTPGIESLFLQVHNQSWNFILGCVYRPPSSNINDDCTLLDVLGELTTRHDKVFVFGDFNMPDISWSRNSGHCRSPSSQLMVDFLTNNHMRQLITQPTRFRANQQPSVLDLILTTEDSSLTNVQYLDPVGEQTDYVAHRAFSNKLSTIIKEERIRYELKIANSNNPKSFYKHVRTALGGPVKIPQVRNVDGNIVRDHTDCANIFAETFSKVFTRESVAGTPKLDFPRNTTAFTDIEFSEELVLEKLRGLDKTKSPGPDRITASVLKTCADILCRPLSMLFGQSFDSGVLPSDWRTAIICPIFKKGDKFDPSNYRPGSVLGPLLFIVYTADVKYNVRSSWVMYADDMKIYNDSLNYQMLSNDISNISKWASDWQLPLNIGKCTVLHIGDKNPCHGYYLGGVELLKSSSCLDLGVLVTSNLSWSEHTSYVVKRANKIVYLLSKTFTKTTLAVTAKVIKSYVRPVLEFGHGVWAPNLKRDIDLLESVQRRATRIPFGRNRPEYSERISIMNLPLLSDRRKRGDVILVHQALTGDKNSSIKHLFPLNDGGRTRGHDLKLAKDNFRTSARQNFITNRVFDVWNSLPVEVVTSKTPLGFKSRYDSYVTSVIK